VSDVNNNTTVCTVRLKRIVTQADVLKNVIY